jgi:hypothetical protein
MFACATNHFKHVMKVKKMLIELNWTELGVYYDRQKICIVKNLH